MTRKDRNRVVGLQILKEKCASCIFGPNSPIKAERFAELRRSWEREGCESFQICHAEGSMKNREVVCSGFYTEIYQRRGIPVALIQIAERLKMVTFILPGDR